MVRVAAGLRRHALIAVAFAEGRWSYDHVHHLLSLMELGRTRPPLVQDAAGAEATTEQHGNGGTQIPALASATNTATDCDSVS